MTQVNLMTIEGLGTPSFPNATLASPIAINATSLVSTLAFKDEAGVNIVCPFEISVMNVGSISKGYTETIKVTALSTDGLTATIVKGIGKDGTSNDNLKIAHSKGSIIKPVFSVRQANEIKGALDGTKSFNPKIKTMPTFETGGANGFPSFATTGARDTAIPSPVDSMAVWVAGILYIYDSITSEWKPQATSSPPPLADNIASGFVSTATNQNIIDGLGNNPTDGGRNALWVQNTINLSGEAEGAVVTLGADGKIPTTVAPAGTLNSEINIKQKTAGENMNGSTTPKAVCIPIAVSESMIVQNDTNNGNVITSYGAIFFGQQFTVTSGINSITKLELFLKKTGSPTGNFEAYIYALDGSEKPTGSPLASATIVASTISTTNQYYTLTFSTPATVVAGTKYALVGKTPNGDSTNNIGIMGTNFANPYAGGSILYTTDGGATWTITLNYDNHFRVYGSYIPANEKVYLANASAPYSIGFVGFCTENIVAENTANIQVIGIIEGLSGLTAGATVYLGNTAGGVSPTAGTNSKKIGVALSSTSMVITQGL